MLHVRVYASAELYGTLALKLVAFKKFNKAIRHSSQPNRPLDSVDEAYALMMHDDWGLRDAIVNSFYRHPDLIKEKRIQNRSKETNSLTYDMFMHWHNQQVIVRTARRF